MSSRRLDHALVERGTFPTRAQAQAAIASGHVQINGEVATKASQRVRDGDVVEASSPHPWVSRGGVKLAHALDAFRVDVTSLTALDVGASTGGFVDVLLSRGARRVIAVDVGQRQIAPKIAHDARVTVWEKTDARALTRDHVPAPVNLVTADLSFISLTKALSVPLDLAAGDASLIALIKPQFELEPSDIGKRGVVTSADARDRAVRSVSQWLTVSGWNVVMTTPSPIRGGDGNVETLVHARRAPRD